MISDAVQKLLPGEGIYAGRSGVEPPAGNPPLGQIKLMPIDYDQIEKDAKMLKTASTRSTSRSDEGRRWPPLVLLAQRIAVGATVEPVKPCSLSGCITKANSYMRLPASSSSLRFSSR